MTLVTERRVSDGRAPNGEEPSGHDGDEQREETLKPRETGKAQAGQGTEEPTAHLGRSAAQTTGSAQSDIPKQRSEHCARHRLRIILSDDEPNEQQSTVTRPYAPTLHQFPRKDVQVLNCVEAARASTQIREARDQEEARQNVREKRIRELQLQLSQLEEERKKEEEEEEEKEAQEKRKKEANATKGAEALAKRKKKEEEAKEKKRKEAEEKAKKRKEFEEKKKKEAEEKKRKLVEVKE